MKSTDVLHLLQEITEKVCAEFQAFPVDIALHNQGKKKVVDIRVQTDSGIESGVCVQIGRRINEELGERDLFDTPYEIQVGSPGIGFPLKNWRALNSQVGRLVTVNFKDKTREPITGYLKARTEQTLEIQTKATKKKEAEILTVSLEEVGEVTVEIDW